MIVKDVVMVVLVVIYVAAASVMLTMYPRYAGVLPFLLVAIMLGLLWSRRIPPLEAWFNKRLK